VLSVGAHRRVPRRYRGRDFIWWINALGLDDKVIEEGTARQPPLLISGANGGRTVDLRRYAADGMALAGRFVDARDGVASFAPDLAANLAVGDASYAAFVQAADTFAAQLDRSLLAEPDPAYPEPVGIETLDLRAAGIGSVIWATGYRYDFGWIDLPVFASAGRPIHRRGVTTVPGAYFLGLQYLHKTKSSFLSGVGEDAAYLAEQIGAGSR
jgi:putative flavoprotein involved in K+ transport